MPRSRGTTIRLRLGLSLWDAIKMRIAGPEALRQFLARSEWLRKSKRRK